MVEQIAVNVTTCKTNIEGIDTQVTISSTMKDVGLTVYVKKELVYSTNDLKNVLELCDAVSNIIRKTIGSSSGSNQYPICVNSPSFPDTQYSGQFQQNVNDPLVPVSVKPRPKQTQFDFSKDQWATEAKKTYKIQEVKGIDD